MADYGVRDTQPENPQEGDTFTQRGLGGELHPWVWTGGRWVPQSGQAPQIYAPGGEPSPWAKKQAAAKAETEVESAHDKAVAALVKKLGEDPDTHLPPEVALLIAEEAVGRQEQGAGSTALAKILGVTPEEADDILNKALATEAPVEETPTEEDTLAALAGEGGGAAGAAGMTGEEKQLSLMTLALQALAEKGTRERASIQELGDIADQWIEMLGRAVTPELKEMIASRTFTKPEEMRTQRVSLADIKQRAEELPNIEGELPQLQSVLRQLLPGFQWGGITLNEAQARQLLAGGAQGTYGSPAATDPYGLGPYEVDVPVGGQWYVDELGNAQIYRPQWQRSTEEMYGWGIPGQVGRPSEEWGPAFQKAIAEGTAVPTMEREQQEFDQEMARIKQAADQDIAEMEAASREEVARIYAAAEAEAAALHAAGMEAQAEATIAAAEASAQATIEAAQIAAQNRLQVAAMQEQGAKERLGAQLGMQWAETSQEMAANPRDFLQLAFRQAGYGVPEALQSFLQPGGGTQPTTAGAPPSIQDILAEYLGQ